MTDVTVLEVPQWHGSSSPTAPRLVSGARSLAGRMALPSVRVELPGDAMDAGVVDGVRNRDALVTNLDAMRSALRRITSPVTVTVGGDCAVDLAPIERALDRHGDRLAVVWFDAHADLNTPASSPSGAFHGMVLRALLGDGPRSLRPIVPLDPRRLVLAGTRALDPEEQRVIEQRDLRQLAVAELAEPASLVEAIGATGAEAVYVHVDLDVLDPSVFGSVGFAEPGGLSPHQLLAAVRAVAERFSLAGVALTEYQPTGDVADATVADLVARTLVDLVAGAPAEDVRRIEQHAIRAWPAPVTERRDGWLLRYTPGMRRLRANNAALPLPTTKHEPGVVDAFYARRDLPAAVQVSPAAEWVGLDERLAAEGYRIDTPIQVLTAGTDAVAAGPEPRAGWVVELDTEVTAAWRDGFVALDGGNDSRVMVDDVIARIAEPTAFLGITVDGRMIGTGLIVGGDHRWAGVYCMATDPDYRRRGVGRAVLRAGARWAAEQGITGLYLQVARSNGAASALYARAGFTRAYSYHYRMGG